MGRLGTAQMTNVTVVIATYNEAESIDKILSALAFPSWRVIIVDDNSPDGTSSIARRYDNVEICVRKNERGIASAYRLGFHIALHHTQPDWIVQMDAGMTHDPADALRLVAKAEDTGADLVIGSRFLYKPEIKGMRTLISLGAAALMRLRGAPVTDATTGFRCWRPRILLLAALYPFRAQGFAFQLETLYQAVRMGANIQEISVPYKLTNSSFRPAMLAEALWIY